MATRWQVEILLAPRPLWQQQSGIAALYWEYRGASETDVNVLSVEVATALQESVTGAGADILFGSGVLNASAAVSPLGSGNDAADKTLFDEPLPVQNLSMMSVPGGRARF